MYSDDSRALSSYGMLYLRYRDLPNPGSPFGEKAYIYLRRLNVEHGIIAGKYNMTDLYSVLEDQSKIYSNGNCDIYKILDK